MDKKRNGNDWLPNILLFFSSFASHTTTYHRLLRFQILIRSYKIHWAHIYRRDDMNLYQQPLPLTTRINNKKAIIPSMRISILIMSIRKWPIDIGSTNNTRACMCVCVFFFFIISFPGYFKWFRNIVIQMNWKWKYWTSTALRG